MTDRITKKRRLERAGFLHVSGWLPAAFAEIVMDQVEIQREYVNRAMALSAPDIKPEAVMKRPRRAPLTNHRVEAMRAARLAKLGLRPRHP